MSNQNLTSVDRVCERIKQKRLSMKRSKTVLEVIFIAVTTLSYDIMQSRMESSKRVAK